jgi:hypothetical protein
MPAASRSKSRKSRSKPKAKVIAHSASFKKTTGEPPLFEKHRNLKLLLSIFCLIELGYFIVYVVIPMK